MGEKMKTAKHNRSNDSVSLISIATGRTIKKIRKRQGLTGEAVAIMLGFSQQQISRYERGVNHMTVSMLITLLLALDISFEEFNCNLLKEIEYLFPNNYNEYQGVMATAQSSAYYDNNDIVDFPEYFG